MTWFAYHTYRGKEKEAFKILEEWKLGAALPTEEVKRRYANSRRQRLVEKVLIPGYIFVDLPSDMGWWHVLHFRHIRAPVGVPGQEPRPFDGRWIESVSKKITPCQVHLRPGDVVEIAAGPAEGHLAKVEAADGKMAEIIVQGWNFPVSVRTEFLERVG